MSGCPKATTLSNGTMHVKHDLTVLARKMARARNGPSQKQLKELEYFKSELKTHRQIQMDHEISCSVCILGKEEP